jgi:uncharacterized membrane protein YhaH (DUF805 family)
MQEPWLMTERHRAADSRTARSYKKGSTMNWYFEVLKKYAVFKGRARRKEYWMFHLFNFVILVVLAVIDSLTGTFSLKARSGLLVGLYSLAICPAGIAVRTQAPRY